MLKRLKITTLALCLLAPGLLMADKWRIFVGYDCILNGKTCLHIEF